MAVRGRIAGILTLVLSATILPEMLSGNTPVQAMLLPSTFLFLILAYGLPMLVIREFAIGHAIGLAGLFMLGLGYGIINEALLAKTVFRPRGLPIDVFDGYGLAFGVQWGWAVFIFIWHAVASTMLPIVFAHIASGDAARKPWIGRWAFWVMSLMLFLLISAFFLYVGEPSRSPLMLAFWWLAIAALVVLSTWLRAKAIDTAFNVVPWRLVVLGIAGLLPLLALIFSAHFGLHFAVFVVIAVAFIALFGRAIRPFDGTDNPALGWFGFGWYLQIASFSWLGLATKNPLVIPVDLVALGAIWWIVRPCHAT